MNVINEYKRNYYYEPTLVYKTTIIISNWVNPGQKFGTYDQEKIKHTPEGGRNSVPLTMRLTQGRNPRQQQKEHVQE